MDFGVGDSVLVCTLAWRLYRACKSSATEFQRIAAEVSGLHAVLKEIDESIEEDDTGLSAARAERLKELKGNAWAVLRDLEAELGHYDSLATTTQRKWDIIRFGLKDLADIRNRIISTTTSLAAFQTVLVTHSHSRLEKVLMKFVKEVGAGLHEGSALTSQTADSINTREMWKQLRKELEELGITAAVLNEKRELIIDVLRRAFAEGVIDEAEIPDLEGDPGFLPPLSTSTTVIDDMFELRKARCESVIGIDQGDETRDITSSRRSSTRSYRKKRPLLASLVFKLFGSDIRIIEAADEGNLERILQLIRVGANIQATDKWQWTALHMAAYGGYEEMARVLIESGANLDARTVDNETPLKLAEMKGHVGVVNVIEEEMERRTKMAKNMETSSD
ncbi:hypothetical protein H2201_006307 [Coniosporium apollinis]|uniref:Fungal N-terminal domain-containing protein n=2 Tax=Coniosporium TaxID=2810619 RepID=A0ABQ9NM44_9PEZI|nr:hypothetical protein H2199_004971 [Cladosporium sp. JES 115]KAJ9661827.1 hypothetical protein H2201_006307 [Coniosporium apollinis]